MGQEDKEPTVPSGSIRKACLGPDQELQQSPFCKRCSQSLEGNNGSQRHERSLLEDQGLVNFILFRCTQNLSGYHRGKIRGVYASLALR